MKRGGRLFLTTPNYFGGMGLYRLYRRLRGRDNSEVGQPINLFTTVPRTAYWLLSAGLRIIHIGGSGHYLPFPARPPIRLNALDKVAPLAPFALHSFFLAVKP